jgi:hypothetical protein
MPGAAAVVGSVGPGVSVFVADGPGEGVDCSVADDGRGLAVVPVGAGAWLGADITGVLGSGGGRTVHAASTNPMYNTTFN